MTAEALSLLLGLNLAAGAAILLVLLLRPLARRWFGAHQAYALWLAVPLAVAGALLPAAEATGAAGPLEAAHGRAQAWLSQGLHAQALATVWALGVAISIGLVAWRCLRFRALARSGRAGPAVVGLFAPRLVVPSDFAERFTSEQRRLVRAHERAHVDRLDPRCNALALALQCLNWFNPMVHVAAWAMRFDQELACDATVMAALPAERRRYAETLLHTQQGATVSPLGCGWSGAGAHPLVTRLGMLLSRRPGERRRSLGAVLLAALWMAALAGAWAAQPPQRSPERPHLILLDLTPADAAAGGASDASL